MDVDDDAADDSRETEAWAALLLFRPNTYLTDRRRMAADRSIKLRVSTHASSRNPVEAGDGV
jgi:hypothetical protein